MCIQLLHQHTYHYYGLGPLIPCPAIQLHLPFPVNPNPTTNIPPNHITRPIAPVTTPCPFCFNRLIARTQPISIIDPRATFPFNSIVYVQPTCLDFSNANPNPSVVPVQYPQPQPQLPVYQQLYQSQPQPHLGLSVPPNVIREIRQEILGGGVVAVEHFHVGGSETGEGDRRGHNPDHGFDTGPLPPGWGPSPANRSEPTLDLAVSIAGIADEREGDGLAAGDVATEEVQHQAPIAEQQPANNAPRTLVQASVGPANDSQSSNGQHQENSGVEAQASPVNERQGVNSLDIDTPN